MLPSFVTVVVMVAVTVVWTFVDDEMTDDSLPFAAAPLRIPPTAPPEGEVERVAFWARALKASRVLPVAGALMAVTMPL